MRIPSLMSALPGFVVVLFVPFSLSAQTSLGVANTRGYPGQTASVPFTVRQATNVVAAQFDLAYNSAKGTLREPVLATRHSNHVVRSREIAPGVRRVLVYSPGNALLLTNGLSGSFAFEVPASERVGSGPITPQGVLLARANATAIAPVSARSGTVFVTPVYRDPASGVVDLFFRGEDNQRYLLQATTNFIHWENLEINVASGSFVDWMDRDASRYPYRFYRTALFDALGSIGNLALLDGGWLSFQITGLEGRRFIVQTSTNLTNWLDLSTVTAVGGSVRFTNAPDLSAPQRFFRLKSAP